MKRFIKVTAITLTICLALVSHPFLVLKAEEVDNDPWGMLNQAQLEAFLYKYTTSTTGYQLQYNVNSGSWTSMTVNTWYTATNGNIYQFRNRFQITETAIAGTFIVFIPIQTQKPITWDNITISHGGVDIEDILGYGTTGRFIWVAYESNAYLSASTNYITVVVDGLKNYDTGFRAPQNTSLLFQLNDNNMGDTSDKIMMTELLLMYLKMKSIQDNGSAEVNIDLSGIEAKLEQIKSNQTSIQTILNSLLTSSNQTKSIVSDIYDILVQMTSDDQQKVDDLSDKSTDLNTGIDNLINTEDSMSSSNSDNISNFTSNFGSDANNAMQLVGPNIQRYMLLREYTGYFINTAPELRFIIIIPIILFIFSKILGG